MSDYQPRENGGLLFSQRSNNPASPRYRGDVNVGGRIYELAVWVKKFQSGEGLSCSFREVDDVMRAEREERERARNARRQEKEASNGGAPAPRGRPPKAAPAAAPKGNDPYSRMQGAQDGNDFADDDIPF